MNAVLFCLPVTSDMYQMENKVICFTRLEVEP